MMIALPPLSPDGARMLDASARFVGACLMGSIALSLAVSDLALEQTEDALASFGLSEFFGTPFVFPV